MASLMRRWALYLGLAPDSDYEDDEVLDTNGVGARRATSASAPVAAEPVAADRTDSETTKSGSVRTLSSVTPEPAQTPRVPAADPDEIGPKVVGSRPRTSVVRSLTAVPSARPHNCTPTSFDDAQQVADLFKSSRAVIMNLQGADQSLSRRLIDFSSGLCYGLGGQMERVADQVYLLTPAEVELAEDVRRKALDPSNLGG